MQWINYSLRAFGSGHLSGFLSTVRLTKTNLLQVKSKGDVNKVTKSECRPEKAEKSNEIGLETPAMLGASFESDPAEAEYIEKLVSDTLAALSEKPDSQKYG